MDIGLIINNLWILIFLLLFLVPQIQRYLLNSARSSLLRRIAEVRRSTVITLIHRQETVAFFGIPLARYIDIDDSEEVLRAIRTAPPDSPIDLILHMHAWMADPQIGDQSGVYPASSILKVVEKRASTKWTIKP